MRRKLIKIIAIGCVLTMMMGTAVMAYGYNFYLVAGRSQLAGLVYKTSIGNAYVDRTGPAGTTTVVTVNMCNGEGYLKSSVSNIVGIGHAYLIYTSGTTAGDYVALNVTNDVSQNGGKSISASGSFTP
ncbi:MAG: hypothetical protein HDQ95_11280 [Roseburia sp.]|nr:hypothetical protein [Roseburia sp.]